jgi:ATP-binding cassette subfamily C protein
VGGPDLVSTALRAVRSHLLIIVTFSAAINVLYLAPSLYMMQVYDRVLPTSGILTLILLSVVLVVALAVMGVLDALRGRLLARASLRVERLAASPILREALATRRLAPNAEGLAGIRELDTMRGGLASPAMIGLLDIPWTPLFILICFVIHVWIGALAVAGAVIIVSLALLNERVSRKSLGAVSQKSSAFYSAHENDLNMAEALHALGAEGAMSQRRMHIREGLTEAQTRAAFDGAFFSSLTKATRLLLQSAALGVGCYLAVEGQISAGAVIAASILTARAYSPVEQIVGGWRQLGNGFAAFQRLRKALTRAERSLERTPLPAPVGDIMAEGVAGTAPGGRTLALQGVSFSAGSGAIVGIVGPSGAGKTTLARILANAAPTYAGAVRIDGARYSDWDTADLARHIGYLPQRIDLFDGTVADNIACFARVAGEPQDVVGPRVVEAARLAGAHQMILALPGAYETVLGFSGAGVSPGQAQRIALARALYGKPRVLVLDEPNSHLDSEGEVALVNALLAARSWGAVSFVIAHRAGVINIADKVLVLREGRLIDFGPRAEVMARLAPATPVTPLVRPGAVGVAS